MKTKFSMVFLAMILFIATATAQENKHMEFMGIPITGTANDFSTKLKSKGFRSIQGQEGIISLLGKFTNKEVVVTLVPIDGTNDIYRVGVIYEPNTSWDQLESAQNYLVEQFTKKYGAPTQTVREIDSPYKDSGNFILLGFHNGEVKYSDTWALQNGYIQISIYTASSDSAGIMIIYEDSVNAQILEDNIQNEI